MVIGKIKTFFVNKWIKDNIIDESDRELYEYGIEVTVEYGFNILTTLIIAYITNEWLACLFLYGSFKELRSFAGGVHAKTFFRCYIYSSLIILFSLLFIKYNIINIWIYRVGAIISGCFLMYTKPVPSENKELNEAEITCFTKKEKHILLIIMAISIIAFWGRFDKIEKGIDSTLIIVAISIVIAKFNEYNKRISIMKDAVVRIAICDDDDVIANKLKDIINDSEVDVKGKCIVDVYNSAEELIDSVEDKECIDILFMDIMLGDSNGIEVAKRIKEVCPDVLLIYVTAFQDYVYEVFETVPIGFVRKPFEKDEIENCLNRATKMLQKQDIIFVKKGRTILKVPIKDIIYIYSAGREVFICDKNNEKYGQYGKLDEYEEKLSSYSEFIRIHKSNLVNFDYVVRYEGKKVTLSNDIELNISRDKRNCVREKYLEMIEI